MKQKKTDASSLESLQKTINDNADRKAHEEWKAVCKAIDTAFAPYLPGKCALKSDEHLAINGPSVMSSRYVSVEIDSRDFFIGFMLSFIEERKQYWASEFTARLVKQNPGIFD